MSYLSNSPQVYPYAKGEVTSSLDRRIPLYTNRQSSKQGSLNRHSDQKTQEMPPIPAFNQFGQSQIEAVFQPIPQSQHQQPLQVSHQSQNIYYQRVSQNTPQSTSHNSFPAYQPRKISIKQRTQNINVSQFQHEREVNNKYNEYLSIQERSYKYNTFSIIDQPWNRCTKGLSCQNLSKKQCLAEEVNSQDKQIKH